MMQLKAKCDLWIAVLYSGDSPVLSVQLGYAKPIGWLMFVPGTRIIQMQTADILTFNHVDNLDDPYAQLATRYPEWFEVVESVP